MIVFKFNKTRLRLSFNLLGKINIINKTVIIGRRNICRDIPLKLFKSKKKKTHFVFMKSENCRLRLVFQTKGILKPTHHIETIPFSSSGLEINARKLAKCE